MKHDCDSIQFEISEILDDSGTLPSSLHSEMQSCAECQEFHDLWAPSGSLSQLASSPLPEVTANIDYDAIQAAIASPEPSSPAQKKNRLLVFSVGAITSAAALIALLVVLSQNQGSKDNQSPDHTVADQTPANKITLPEDSFKIPELKTAFSSKQVNKGARIVNEKTTETWRKAKNGFSSVKGQLVRALSKL